MFENLLSSWSSSLGISVYTLLGIIVAWDLVWRCVAVWKSTKKNQPIWSIVFVLFQTVGILPILYILVFSKMKSFASRNNIKRRRR